MAEAEKIPGRWFRPTSRGRHLLLGAIATTLFAGCTQKALSPEDEIRQTIAKGEAAVRAKDLDAVESLIATGYSDEEGRTKAILKAVAARYFLASKTIHILTRIHTIDFPTSQRAEVVLFAATAGTEITDLSILPNIRAEILRTELRFVREDGVWKVSRAVWAPATMEEMLE